jgi:hypothetical protein
VLAVVLAVVAVATAAPAPAVAADGGRAVVTPMYCVLRISAKAEVRPGSDRRVYVITASQRCFPRSPWPDTGKSG